MASFRCCRAKLRGTFSSCTMSIFHGIVATVMATYEVGPHCKHTWQTAAHSHVRCVDAQLAPNCKWPCPLLQLKRAWPVDVAATNTARLDLVMTFSTVRIGAAVVHSKAVQSEASMGAAR